MAFVTFFDRTGFWTGPPQFKKKTSLWGWSNCALLHSGTAQYRNREAVLPCAFAHWFKRTQKLNYLFLGFFIILSPCRGLPPLGRFIPHLPFELTLQTDCPAGSRGGFPSAFSWAGGGGPCLHEVGEPGAFNKSHTPTLTRECIWILL